MLSFIMTGKEVEQREIAYNWNSPGFIESGDARFAKLGSFQKAVFDYIKERPRCTQASSADAYHTHRSRVSEAVSKLVEKRLVSRSDNKLVAVFDI